jgi:integrase/recombinase XerD
MSKLSLHLSNYLTTRRQLGFKLVMPGRLLRNFVRFAERKRARFITTRLALRWAVQPPNILLAQRANRLGMVRRFAEYLSAIDYRTEIPPQKLLPYQFRRQAPYVYSEEEVARLIQTARRINPRQELKGVTYETLFGLLAATGMRVGEAIALDREDVNLKNDLITIRRAKGNKSRFVPTHPSTSQMLLRYAALRDRTFPDPISKSYFVSERGTRLLHCSVNRWFLWAARQLGLRKRRERGGPRLHDLRHRFAINILLAWYRSKTDVEARLPELATYLGHVHVRHTYWYLSAAPELLRLATLRLERAQKRRRL